MKLLKAKDVANKLGFSLHYFRAAIAVAPGFPKPIQLQNGRGGMTQPRWPENVIDQYLQSIN